MEKKLSLEELNNVSEIDIVYKRKTKNLSAVAERFFSVQLLAAAFVASTFHTSHHLSSWVYFIRVAHTLTIY
jgi:hypothetical protein